MAGVFLGSIYGRLELKTNQFKSELAKAKGGLGGLTGASKNAAKALAPIGIAAGVSLGYASKQALDFESLMSNVSTLIAGDSKDAVAELSDGILEMTKRVPKSADELGASAYSIMSAGITDTGEALKVLESSSKLAVAGLGTTEEATNLMTSAMNSFEAEGLSATQVSDILFKTVKNGKTTVAELSQGFGAVAGQAAETGIPLQDFMSTVSALTTVGVPASQAYTQIRAAMAGLTRETVESKEVFSELGVKTFKELVEKTGGVGKAFQAIKKEVGDNDAKMLKLVGSTEALAAITSISGATSEAYASTLDDMGDSAYGVEEAFAKQKDTAGASLQLLKNELNAVAITLGSKLLPFVTRFANFLASTFIPAVKRLSTWLNENRIVLAIIGGAIAAVLIPAFVSWAIAAGAAAIATLASVAPLLAIGAVVGAVAYLIINNWDTIKEYTSIVWGAIKDTVSDVWNVIKTVFNAVIAVIKFVLKGYIAYFKLQFAIAKAVVTTVFKVIKAIVTGVFKVIKAIVGAYIAFWRGVFNTAKSIVVGVFNAISGTVSAVFGTIKGVVSGSVDTIKTTLGGILTWFSELPDKILGYITGFGSLLVDAGKALMQGLLDGIKNGLGAVKDFVTGIADKIFGWKGPIPYDKKVLITNGQALMFGLDRGIRSGLTGVHKTVSAIAPAIQGNLQGATVGASFGATSSSAQPLSGSVGGGGNTYHIGQITLPNVENGEDFARELQLNMYSKRGI